MEGLLVLFLVLILLAQIYFAIVQYRLLEIAHRLHTTNLILTVIANKLGATEEDVKEAMSKGY